jgi:electron transfer flavoprotein alpha subunit
VKDVIAFIEHKNGVARRSSIEALCAARAVAQALGGTTHAVVAGPQAAAVAATLAAYPVDRIHVLDDSALAAHGVDPLVDSLESVARAAGPALVSVTARSPASRPSWAERRSPPARLKTPITASPRSGRTSSPWPPRPAQRRSSRSHPAAKPMR